MIRSLITRYKKFFLVIALFISLIVFGSVFFKDAEDVKGFQFERQPEIERVKPEKPVRIKLRRLAEGRYTWELTGDDVNEIVRTDKQLRKLLKME